MARYTVAAMIRVGICTGFWLVIWLVFGYSTLNILLFAAVLLALFVLSFAEPFLMLIDVRYGHIEGPDGLGSSAIKLEEVNWARSEANAFCLNIKSHDGRAVFADRAHFSAAELEEIFLTFVGGDTSETDSWDASVAVNC
jgi:hypothetical protein